MRFQKFICLIALLMPIQGRAALVEDQTNIVPQQVPPPLIPIGMGVSSARPAGQVVTTGIAGRLSRVDLGVFRWDTAEPLFVDITTVTDQAPSFAADQRLATRTIDAASVPRVPWYPAFTVSLDFTADNLHFDVGDQFAIALRSEVLDMGYVLVTDDAPGGYAGGELYKVFTSGVFGQFRDAHFRTFIETVPEPSTVTLAVSALLSLIAIRRRHVLAR